MIHKNIVVIDRLSEFNDKEVDIRVEDGFVAEITLSKPVNPNKSQTIICPGLVAVDVRWCTPGNEHRETEKTLTQAAIAGGFTEGICLPEIQPFNDVNVLQALLNHKNKFLNCHFLIPILKDNIIIDFNLLSKPNILGFYIESIHSKYLEALSRVFQIAAQLNKPILITPYLTELAPNGVAHEDILSLMNGLLPIPVEAELIALNIILDLAEKFGTHTIISPITVGSSLELIKRRKPSTVVLSTSSEYLNFSNVNLLNFDNRFRCYPPLRSESDQQALIKGLLEDTLQFVTTRHIPRSLEETEVEFFQVMPGSTQLETAFASIYQVFATKTGLSKIVDFFSDHIRKVFRLNRPIVSVGQPLNFTVLELDNRWSVSSKNLYSKSPNNIFRGMSFSIRPKGILTQAGFITPTDL